MTTATHITLKSLKAPSELAQTRPHGDRLRYIGGCRCKDCRRANSAYENTRSLARKAGEWNGLVPASKARAHILQLREQGLGRRQVADAAGMCITTLQLIVSGRRKHLRAMNEKAVLAVTRDALADGARIDAGPTWVLLDELLATGYTKARLAKELGYATRALQIKRTQCTAATAYAVTLMHKRLRRVPAAQSVDLINELRAEGYRYDRIETMLKQLATRLHRDTPDMETYRGFIHAGTAELLHMLHQQITEVPA